MWSGPRSAPHSLGDFKEAQTLSGPPFLHLYNRDGVRGIGERKEGKGKETRRWGGGKRKRKPASTSLGEVLPLVVILRSCVQRGLPSRSGRPVLWRSLENRQSCEGDLLTEMAKGSVSVGFGWRGARSVPFPALSGW